MKIGAFGKRHIAIVAVLSFFALTVTSISTAAWFAVTSSGADPTHNVTAGSSDITINGVSSYKYHYAELDTNTVSTTEGTVSKYSTTASEKTYNPHQDEHNEVTFDTPKEGVGYYLIGNAAFSKSHTSAKEYTYDDGYKMASASEGNATLYNVYLESGMRFNIKRHYYATENNEVISKNVIVSCNLASISGAGKASTSADVVYSGTAGTYTVSLSGSTITLSGFTSGKRYSRRRAKSQEIKNEPKRNVNRPTRTFNALPSNVYYRSSDNEWGTSEEFSAYTGSGSFSKEIFVTMSNGNQFKAADASWNNAYTYNQITNKTNGNFITNVGNDKNIQCNTPRNYHLLLDSNGMIYIYNTVYVRGTVINGCDWSTLSDANKLTITDNDNHAAKTGVTLSTGEFKIQTSNNGDIDLGQVTAQYMPDGETELSNETSGLGSNVFSTQLNGNIYCNHAGIFDIYVYYDSVYKLNIVAHATHVTFDKQSGSGGSDWIGAWEGQAMPSITRPTRTGYTFGGYWDGEGGTGTKYYNADGSSAKNWDFTDTTKTLYAKWVLNTVTITLDDAEGSGGSGYVSASYGSSLPNVSVPTKSGYEFLGYYTDEGGTGDQYYDYTGSSVRTQSQINTLANSGTPLTLYAYWATTTTITFNTQDGSNITGVTAIKGEDMPPLSNPPTTRTGYTLTGIYDESSGGTKYYNADGTSAKVWDKDDSTATLYAQWTANQYTVTLDRQHSTASNGSTSVTATYGSAMPSATMPTWSGYTFGGYYDEQNGSGTKYYNANGTSARTWNKTTNSVLYAQWTIDMTGARTYYVLDDQWTTGTYLAFYAVGANSGGNDYSDFYYYGQIDTPVSGYSNLYQFSVPKYATGGFCIYKGDSLTAVNDAQKTEMIAFDGDDSYSVAQGDSTMILVESENTAGVHKFKWGVLPESKPASSGYYRAVNFSNSAVKMNNEYLSTNDKAVSLRTTVSNNETFQIWRLNGNELTHFDALSGNGGQQATRVNGNIKITNSGAYNIYLESDGEVYVGAYQMYELIIIDGETGEETAYEMASGDITTYNKWVYEKAINVKKGDKFIIHGKSGGSADEYLGAKNEGDSGDGLLPISKTDDGGNELASYKNGTTFLKVSSDSHHGKTAFEFKSDGAYTFYWTRGDKITVASVPTLGYGYYILNEPDKAYAGDVVKMKQINTRTNTQNKAFYHNFYATAGQKIAFRSYLDGVDKYFDHTHINASPSELISKDTTYNSGRDSNHVITFADPGYYHIYITYDDNVSIVEAADESGTAYTLNNLNCAVDTTIPDQNTSLILEIAFTTTCIDPSEILLHVNNDYSSYIGVAFAVTKGHMDDPYEEMRKKVLSTASDISSEFIADANDSSTVYYAYIIIDYTTKTSLPTLAGSASISFALKTRQVVATSTSE